MQGCSGQRFILELLYSIVCLWNNRSVLDIHGKPLIYYPANLSSTWHRVEIHDACICLSNIYTQSTTALPQIPWQSSYEWKLNKCSDRQKLNHRGIFMTQPRRHLYGGSSTSNLGDSFMARLFWATGTALNHRNSFVIRLFSTTETAPWFDHSRSQKRLHNLIILNHRNRFMTWLFKITETALRHDQTEFSLDALDRDTFHLVHLTWLLKLWQCASLKRHLLRS